MRGYRADEPIAQAMNESTHFLGFVFSKQLHQALALLGRLGLGAFALVVLLVAGYLAFKIIKWKQISRPTQGQKSAMEMTDLFRECVKSLTRPAHGEEATLGTGKQIGASHE